MMLLDSLFTLYIIQIIDITYYKNTIEARPIHIVTDYYISRGLEEIKELHGDAAGVAALLNIVIHCEKRMLLDMGLPPDITDIRGRSTSESVDTAYAARIN